MGDVIDFLFGACLLSRIILGVIGTTPFFILAKKSLHEFNPDSPMNRPSDWSWYTSLLRKEHLSFKNHHLRLLLSIYRFCVLGFLTCMDLAILLLIFLFMLRMLLPLAFR